MSTNFSQGLMIAAIGMGLVFLALIMLWGLMALMASIHFRSDQNGQEAEPGSAAPVEAETAGDELRMQAAAAAVAVALGLQWRISRVMPPSPKALSPWQVARRSGQFSQNHMITTRKPRGSAR